MHQTSHDSVSTITFNAASALTTSNDLEQLPVTPPGSIPQSPGVQIGSWIPFTFRWYFIIIPTITSLIFGIAILVLVFHSQRNYGIGADNGSSRILFGWRFTPTLLAVLYTQLTVILFEDAKRTEPFARLASAPIEGASACGTVLQTPRAWWSVFIDVLFKRKSIGRTSWCLICSALINIVALLAISPLSSALLTSEEIIITKSLDFIRIVPKTDVQLPVLANRDTYFRTMAALMRNISTSVWTTDTSLTFPFWPSTEQAQFGPDLESTFSTWAAETTTLHTDFNCQHMTLASAELIPRHYSSYGLMDKGPYNGTEPMVSFVLTSDDGCRYQLDNHPTVDLAYHGGLTWSNTSTHYHVQDAILSIGRMPFLANVSSTSPYARLNTSKECRNRDIIIMSTPWTKPFSLIRGEGPGIELNKTYERSPDFHMKGFLCESHYSMDKRTLKSAMALGQQPTLKYSTDGRVDRALVTDTLVDITKFEALTLQNQWSDYFNRNSMSIDADSASGGYRKPGSDSSIMLTVPGFSGLGSLLGALYSFNISSIMSDKDIMKQAARVKGRFFTECLRGSLTDPEVVETNIIKGHTTITEERILVLQEIGITLAVLFLVSFVLLAIVAWSSRLQQRPLCLQTDPSSTVGHGMLLRSQLASRSTFRSMHQVHRHDFHNALRNDRFYTLNGFLHTGGGSNQQSTLNLENPTYPRHRWQPLVIRLRMLFALGWLLIIVLVAVLVMNAFSAQSRLSALAFIYEADVSKLGLSFSTFAPISIAPTLVSIAIGLWWDQLDMSVRILQPYIAMSQRPTPVRYGAGLTYRSKTWAGAAIKAARNRHWMLFMIAVGSVLCQILTVSMSALFERSADKINQTITLEKTLKIRQDPIITTIGTARRFTNPYPGYQPYEVLDHLLLDPPKNWLPGAAIQLSLSGSKLAWTHEGWSFVPLDLALIQKSSSMQPGASRDKEESSIQSTNVTASTPGIRARLECSPIPEVANVSTWLTHLSEDSVPDQGQYDLKGFEDYYIFNHTIFDGTPSNTSVFANENMVRCCSNITKEGLQRSVIGYWSPIDTFGFPHAESQWPLPFIVKWIVGKPQILGAKKNRGEHVRPSQILLYKETPSLQAARCIPVIETIDAMVLVDRDTGFIHSFESAGPTSPAIPAWSDAFVRHDLTSSSQRYATNYSGPLNMTTSYGILFMSSMFKAADSRVVSRVKDYWEALDDNAFVMRDEKQGYNMDLMTYSMYSLAKKDPEALLNYTTLVEHAGRTFQTFFQHFVSNGMSLAKGGLVYQKFGDDSMEGLGPSIAANGSLLSEQKYAGSDTDLTVDAWISHYIQVLHMNPTATYLSLAILIWLIITTTIMISLQRKYTSSMIRDVQLIADVLVLMAGSDNFLRLIHERGVDLKKDTELKTMLGWFKDRDGQVRWGVEMVGGRDAVEWVDAPNLGPLDQKKGS